MAGRLCRAICRLREVTRAPAFFFLVLVVTGDHSRSCHNAQPRACVAIVGCPTQPLNSKFGSHPAAPFMADLPLFENRGVFFQRLPTTTTRGADLAMAI